MHTVLRRPSRSGLLRGESPAHDVCSVHLPDVGVAGRGLLPQDIVDAGSVVIADRRDNDIESRAKKLEADLAELEAEGAKSDVRRKVRESGEREMASIRRKADADIERLDRIFDRFRTLKVQDLEGDEMLFREMRDRYGRWFDGGMGAAAIQKRLQSFDLEAESLALREIVATGASSILASQPGWKAARKRSVAGSLTSTVTDAESPSSLASRSVPRGGAGCSVMKTPGGSKTLRRVASPLLRSCLDSRPRKKPTEPTTHPALGLTFAMLSVMNMPTAIGQ